MRCMGMTEGIKVCLTLLGFVIATCAKPKDVMCVMCIIFVSIGTHKEENFSS